MIFVSAITTCLRKYVVFSGRATRAEFWWWVLAVMIASVVLSIVDGVVSAATGGKFEDALSTIFSLAVLLPNLAVTSRRLHDIGKSGWWQLVWILAVAGAWAVLAIMVISVVVKISLGQFFGDWTFDETAASDIFANFVPVILGFFFAVLVTIVIAVWGIIWLARQGQSGSNRYGPSPRIA